MSGLFYNMGRMLGPHVRKTRWVWQSITGNEVDAIRLERDVGQDLVCGIRQQLKLDPDPQIAHLLNEVGSRLAGCVANKLRTFGFETFEGGEPNAFALPGGYIFVSRSLVELCKWNQDEIAFILGHEMSHVIRGHAMNRIITNSAITLGSRFISARGSLTGLLNTVGVRLLESSYSQELEIEADKLGALLVVAAGYNSKAPAALLSRLAKLSQSGVESSFGHYFSSHPSFNLRIQNIG
ncbi:MAG: M48 family metallopeptidase [Sedimentisphaerales bacterium]